MPKTKRAIKRNVSENIKPNTSALLHDMKNTYLKEMKTRETMRELNIQTKANNILLKVNNVFNEQFLRYRQYTNKTMNEIKNTFPQEPTSYDKTVKSITMNSTKSRSRNSRSTSIGTKGRPSRTAASSTVRKQTRRSRSLSRSKQSKFNLLTPAWQPKNAYGIITPKVKPNTPQVVLRRPQQGEMAVSMQGSPLMVDHITNRKPNVNIPLIDGRVYSILPEKGLRTSELPDIDPHVREQIQTLRDNLSKVLSGKL